MVLCPNLPNVYLSVYTSVGREQSRTKAASKSVEQEERRIPTQLTDIQTTKLTHYSCIVN